MLLHEGSEKFKIRRYRNTLMAKHKVAVLPGDGIGPEVVQAGLRVLEAVEDVVKGLEVECFFGEAGLSVMEKYGTNLPEETMELLKRCECVLKGPMTTPEVPEAPPSVAVTIRKAFDLYANIRPSKSYEGTRALKRDVDLVIVRENTEGMYSGVEYKLAEGVGVALRIITSKACARIADYAFKLARSRKRKVTFVHKANILRLTDGVIFKGAVLEAAKRYADVELEEAHVDAMAMNLVKKPELYDVILTENLFGDVLSDLAAEVAGGIGIAPCGNLGETYAMFEPVHGSAPKMAGKNVANPTATILAIKMMMEWLNEFEAAEAIESAVRRVLSERRVVTYDLGGSAKTHEMAEEVARKIGEEALPT